MLPFAKTKEERMASGDARPSLAERYPNPGDRAALIEKEIRFRRQGRTRTRR
jgi:hypothetical protein